MRPHLFLAPCLAPLLALAACGGGDPVDQPLSEDEVRQLEAAAEMLDSRKDVPAGTAEGAAPPDAAPTVSGETPQG